MGRGIRVIRAGLRSAASVRTHHTNASGFVTMSGNEGLFVIEDGGDIIGAVTYEVIGYDTGLRVLAINYAGGVNMDTQMPAVMEMFHALKRHFMCDRVRITGRKGWVRYMKQFGFTDTHYSVEME